MPDMRGLDGIGGGWMWTGRGRGWECCFRRRNSERQRHRQIQLAPVQYGEGCPAVASRTAPPSPTCIARHVVNPPAVRPSSRRFNPVSLEIEERSERLALDDRLTFYTDGLPEARNEKGELYGFERVEKLLVDGAASRGSCGSGEELWAGG